MEFFREITYIIAAIVKHDLGNSKFDPFGANLRKFHRYGVKIDTLGYMIHLRHLHRMAQVGFERCLKFPNFDP